MGHFGYESENGRAVVASYGEDNRFSPGPKRRGQPIKFQPGRSRRWPHSAFRVRFDGEPLTWFLRGPDGVVRSATISKHAPHCGAPQPTACEAVFWGPRRFTRTSGAPNVFTETVAVPAWVESPHVLQVVNGEPSGRKRVSSARISIDGKKVAGPSDFSRKVDGFVRPVDLATESTLEVRLASAPGSYLLLSLCGENGDDTAPLLAWTRPGPATNDPTPRLALTYEDRLGSGEPGASGVDPDTLVVSLDGTDRTALFTKRPGDASAELPDELALDEGSHTLVARVQDHAGNEAEATLVFLVDLQPPGMAITAPVAGDYQAPPVTVRVTYTDDVELDLASLRLLLNGVDRTSSFTVGPAEAVATLGLAGGLVEGVNALEAGVADRAGNTAVASVAFNVDASAPTLTLGQPAAGSRHGSSDVEVTLQYLDEQALDLESFAAEVDGTPVSLTPVPGGATGWIGPLADGTHRLVVRISDRAGNTGAAESEFVVDTRVPDVQIVQPPAGSFTPDPAPSFLVTYEDADGVDTATLRVVLDGLDRTDLLTVEPDMAYGELPLDASLADGDHTLTAEIQDLTGNTGSDVAPFLVDTVAPDAILDAPPPLTNAPQPTVTLRWIEVGSGVDPQSVQIQVDGADRTGLFAVDASGATGVLALDPPPADGLHEIGVELADRASNAARPVFSFTLDTVPPDLTVTPAPDSFVNDPTPLMRVSWTEAEGSGADPASLRVFLKAGEDAEVEITDRFTVGAEEATAETPDVAALTDGTWRLRVTLSDLAGNAADAEATFVVDTAPPTFTVEAPVHNAILGTATPAFDVLYDDEASGVDPARLALLVDGVDRSERLTWGPARATGALLPEDALLDGVHALEVQVFDRAGNAAVPQEHTFQVDTIPPTARVEAPLDGSYVGSGTPFVRVTFQDEGDQPSGVDPSSVVVEVDGEDRTADLTVSEGAAEGALQAVVAGGPHAVVVRVADRAGHPATATASFFVDTQPPALSELSLEDGDWVAELDPEGRLEIRGTIQDLDPQVSLRCRVGTSEVEAAISGSAFSCSVPLTEGSHSVEFIATDGAGNSATLTRSVNVDLTPPTVTILDPADGSYSSAASLTVTGTVVDRSPVQVEVQGVAAVVTGEAFVAAGLPASDDGPLTLQAVATDAAGNTSTDEVTVTLDRVPPNIRITWPEAGAAVQPTVEVQGTFSDESPVSLVYVNDQEATLTGGGTTSGTFAATVSVGEGAVTFEARGHDAAGNVGTDSVAAVVDTVAPMLVVGEPVPGTVTRATSLRVAGTVTDATAVTLLVDGQPVPVGPDGAFAYDLSLGPDDGPRTITLVATDLAGNATTTAVDVVVDRTPPELEIVTPEDGAVVGALPVVVQGLVQDATETTVTVDGVEAVRTGAAWTASFATLEDGPHTFEVVATDAAGNVTTRTRDVVVDLSSPELIIISPLPGQILRDPTVVVSGTVTSGAPATVSVNGLEATVSDGVFTSPPVPLDEGDNTLRVVAVNTANGRTGEASVLVTRDSTPPIVTLTAPETISRETPGQAAATATDALGVALVEIRLGDVLLGSFTAPPYEVELVVPDGAEGGDTLVVSATATDLAGNTTTATRGVRVATAGVVVGQVLDDATSQPLAEATVRVVSGDTGATVDTDALGRFSLPTQDARVVLTAEADGRSSVDRAASVVGGVGNVVVDARLAPLAEPVPLGPAGGTLGGAALAVTVPAGALEADTGVRLTPLSSQGLPGLLPLGFSPVVALDLRTVDEAPVLTPLELAATGLPDETVHLVAYRFSTHGWYVVARDLVATDGALTTALPQAGAYALVAADPGEPEVTVPEPGQDLGGVEVVPLPPDATSVGEVTPSVVPPAGGTAEGRLTVSSSTPLPSGTVVQAEVTETYALSSGEEASVEPRRHDLVIYRAGAARMPLDPEEPAAYEPCTIEEPTPLALCAVFPITPTRSYDTADLLEGTVHLDILAGREGVRGEAGGNAAVTLETEGLGLSVAGGSLAEDTAVALEAAELSSFLPEAPGVTALREAVVDLSGAQLSMAAELSMDAATVPAGGTLVVARVERLESIPRLVVVALAERTGTRVVSRPYPGLPGIREEGRYVFLRLASSIGFVAGTTSTAEGPVASEVATGALPFVFLAGPDGAYIVPAVVGSDVALTAAVPGTSLVASAEASVAETLTTALDLTLTGSATTAAVSPANGALGVPVTAQVEITSPVALDPGTVTTDSVRLLEGEEPVAVRFVLSATARRLAVVPEEPLAWSTLYAVRATGLHDALGADIVVPETHFTTAADIPPVYDPRALTFSFPDEDGLVQAVAPPGSLPPGTTVLIINSGNGVVVTFTALNDGSVSGELPATIDDQLLITITDPLGNVFSSTRSEFRAPDGRTAIGAGGGVVEGEGGVELRVPGGAVDEGVVLKVEPVDPATIPPDEIPDFGTDDGGEPVAQLGAALRITAEETPVFKKEADLVFPVPEGATEDAFFYVYRRLEGPDGKVAFETLDHAFIEGEGEDARVVTASPPLSGYVDMAGAYDATGGVASSSTALNMVMWSLDQNHRGEALTSITTGKVLRVKWDPGATSPSYEPVPAGSLVVGTDGAGQPLISGDGAFVARTQPDGTYALVDARNVGGTTSVAASVDGEWRTASVYEMPSDDRSPSLGVYPNVFTANITFPAVPPAAPPPAVGIFLMEQAGGQRRLISNGLSLEDVPLLIGLRVENEGVLTEVTVEGRSYSFREDTRPEDQPLHMDFVLDAPYTPETPGTYTVEATVIPPFGPEVKTTSSFRVLAAGGGGVDTLPDEPPAVIGEATVPSHGATSVPTSVFPQISFSEPVRNVLDHVRLVDLGEEPGEGDDTEVEVLFSGVGPDEEGGLVVWDPVPDAQTVVTSLTLQPRGGLKYARRYRIVVEGGPGGVEDLDRDPFDEPAPKTLEPTPYEAEFITYGPEVLTPPGSGEVFGSPGIVRLDQTVYLVENHFLNGTLRAFDVSNPVFPQSLDLEGDTLVYNRPVDLGAEGNTVVVASGPTNQSKPSNLFVFDVTDAPLVRWTGAVGLTNGVNDGFIFRITVRDGLAYASTFRKGIQVVDLTEARQNLEEATGGVPFSAGYWDMIAQLTSDGRQFGSDAVVMTVPVNGPLGASARLVDLKVTDAVYDGASQPVVAATGDVGLVLVNPQAGAVVAQSVPESSDGAFRLESGTALALGRLADRTIAVVGGSGLVSNDPETRGSLLAVVDITDPTTPVALGFTPLPESPGDVALHGDLALVAGVDRTYLVSVAELTRPFMAGGALEGLAGRLAVDPDSSVVFSSARSLFGGSDPLGGVRSAVLNPGEVGACPLLTLKNRRVLLDLTLDTVNETLCGHDQPVFFGLCEPATVTFTVDGEPVMSSVDGNPQTIVDVALPAGPHVIQVPAGILGGVVATTKPFALEARSIADPGMVRREEGTVEADIRNRSVLPVGHTFVKGVDIFDGHVVRQSNDIQIPGRHLGLSLTRSYSSAAKGADGALGAGWSFNYASSVFPSSCGLYVVTTPDGSSQTFRTTDGGQNFTPQKGYHTTLLRNEDNSYDFIDKAGMRHHFRELVDPDDQNSGRRLDYIEEPHGDRIEVRYDERNRVDEVAEVHPEAGDVRRLHFTWTRAAEFDRIKAVESDGPLALRVEYEYDEWGNLVAVRRAGSNVAGQPSLPRRVERYTYSTEDPRDRYQLLSATDGNGSRVEYDYYDQEDDFPGEASGEWVSGLFVWGKEEYVQEVHEFPSEGVTVATSFAYDYTNAVSGTFATTVTDARGNDTAYTLNGNGSPTLIEEPLDKTTQIRWAEDDIYKIEERDALGRLTTYGHDERGNLTRETIETADFGPVTTEWRYHPTFNKLTYKKDPEGPETFRETFYEIDDETGDLRSTTDALDNVTTYDYDLRGRLKSVTDPRDHTTLYTNFDSFGNARRTTDPLGNVTTREWDERGRLVSSVDTMGHATETVYDAFDRPTRETRRACTGPCDSPAGVEASDDAVTTTVYYPEGQVRLVRNPNGSDTEYTLDGMNRVIGTVTTLPEGARYETVTGYDGNGNKTLETDRRGVTRTMAYDALNRLEGVSIEAGSTGGGPYREIAAYDYDLVGNKTSETDVMGQTTDFVYDDLYRVETKVLPEEGPSGRYSESYTYDLVGNRLTLTDANDHTTTWEYDDLDRVTLIRNALGQETTTSYDDPEGSHVNKSEEHDLVRGLRMTFAHDALNREIRREQHLEGPGGEGAVYITTTTYDDDDHSVLVTDPRQKRTLTFLDSLDRPTVVIVDEGDLDLETRLSYDGLGNRKALRDPRSFVTQWVYDGLGRQVAMVDAMEKRSEAQYDGQGLKQWERDRRGVARTFEYDSLGRLKRETVLPSITAVDWSREIEYRDLALQRVETDARGHATTFDLDRMGRVVRETDALTHTIETDWDGVNRRQVTDKRGYPTFYEYDALNRVTVVRNALDQEIVTTYRDEENATEERDRRGIVRRTELDPLGRVRRVIRPWDTDAQTGTVLELHTWDGNGNRTSQTDAEGRRTEFTYDGANRLVGRTDGVGTPVEASIEYRYDANGNRTMEIDERHTEDAPTLRSSYDPLNRLASTTNGEGEATIYGYDEEGNRTSVQEPKGQVTTFAYGELAELLSVTQPPPTDGASAPVTVYGYDENRNRTSQTDANGHIVEMVYDELDRMTSMIQDAADGGLELTSYHDYDPNGNETLLTDPKGQEIASAYDPLNRLELKTYTPAPGETEIPWRRTTQIAYDYDENDNLKQVDEDTASGTDPPVLTTLTTIRTYDELDRLETETTTLPDGGTRTVAYTYYDNGNRKSVTDPDGVTTAYAYDGKNRLETATTQAGTPQAQITTYSYFPDDLTRTVTYPNGVTASHLYDKANRLESLTNARGGVTVSAYGYTYDDNGNRESQVETNGGTTETTTYGYDALNRLTRVTYPADADYPSGREVTYGYDAVGNRRQETTTVTGDPGQVLADQQGVFDTLNRLTELQDLVDPAQSQTFGWDDNGNQISKTVGTGPGAVTTEYLYDVRDKLIEARQDMAVLSRFQYDFEGRRNLKIGESGLRQYVYDDTSLFTEYDSAGLQTAKYDYGSDRLIALTHQTEGRRYYSLDGLRSVVNLTNDAGSTVASYHLDAWGNFRFPDELDASRNRFAFTGHYYDPETSLYNAKARYFDPKLGRFLTQDSFLGNHDNPPSLHRYLYANANPLFFVDPTGHYSWSEFKGDVSRGYQALKTVAQTAYAEYQVAKGQVVERQGADLQDPYKLRQLAVGAQMLRNLHQRAVDRTAGRSGSVVGAGVSGYFVETIAGAAEMPSNAIAGLANLAMPGGFTMARGGEPSEAELAYAPVRQQQVAGLKAALDPNFSLAERAAHGFAAVATTPVVIVEGLTWGAGGKASDAVGEHLNKATMASSLTDAGFETLQAGQQFLTAFSAFGNLAAPLASSNLGRNPRVLSGHGGYIEGAGTTTVPKGTSLTTWTRHGNTITDSLGNAIESGNVGGITFQRFGQQIEGARSFLPGAEVPNYTLFPPEGLNIVGNPTTVSQATMLKNLLRPNMGNVHWAACQECIVGMPLPPAPTSPALAVAGGATSVLVNDRRRTDR